MQTFRDIFEGRKSGSNDRFFWKQSDIKYNVREEEEPGSYSNPRTGESLPKRYDNKKSGAQFADHVADIKKSEHKYTPSFYRQLSESINKPFRDGKKHEAYAEKHISSLDHITSHKFKQDTTLYRGYREGKPNWKLKKGDEFTDHGYTSTAMDHHLATKFRGPMNDSGHQSYGDLSDSKHHIFRIHAPAGTMGHHIGAHGEHPVYGKDPNNKNHTSEVLLHRGTRFRVGDHHHMTWHDGNPDNDPVHYHVTDLHVIGQG